MTAAPGDTLIHLEGIKKIFYTDELDVVWLGVAVSALAAAVIVGRTRVPWVVALAPAAIVCWIALHEAGLTQAVATNGTALGESHFELLKNFVGAANPREDARPHPG